MAGKKYLLFCQQSATVPLPVTEQKLLNFVALMANQRLRHQTMKSYLSTVRHLQIECGCGDPRVESMPRLELILRGVKREQAGVEKRTRLPITPLVLERLHRVWSQDSSDLDAIMMWAVCCVGFVGFLRSGEMTSPDSGPFDPSQHLSFNDVSIDNVDNPQSISLRIKQSKTDPFRQGATIHLSKTDRLLCPVSALLAYMVWRGKGEGPLFLQKGGQPLTRSHLVAHLRRALSEAGFDPEKCAGHSFRIGAATTAAACGVPVDVVKTLGRWKSQAYQLYIRIPDSQLSAISNSLAGAKI